MTDATIRRATTADLDLVAPLFDGYRQFYERPADPVIARQFIADRLAAGDSVLFLAVSATGAALGFAQLYPSFSSVSARRIWILNDLFVTPQGRGQGIGQQLLEAARRHGVETGAK